MQRICETKHSMRYARMAFVFCLRLNQTNKERTVEDLFHIRNTLLFNSFNWLWMLCCWVYFCCEAPFSLVWLMCQNVRHIIDSNVPIKTKSDEKKVLRWDIQNKLMFFPCKREYQKPFRTEKIDIVCNIKAKYPLIRF